MNEPLTRADNLKETTGETLTADYRIGGLAKPCLLSKRKPRPPRAPRLAPSPATLGSAQDGTPFSDCPRRSASRRGRGLGAPEAGAVPTLGCMDTAMVSLGVIRIVLLALAASVLVANSLTAAAPSNAEAEFVQGLTPYQVLPSKNGKGVVSFRAKGPGRFEAQVEKQPDGTVVARREWELTSAALSGELSLDSVPVGGEYTVRCRLNGREKVWEHILVGEIWVVSGQSNALGAEGRPYEPIPQVHLMRDGKWQEGRDPLFPWFGGEVFIAPWIEAAREYYKRTGIPVGLMGFCVPGKEIEFFMDFFHKEVAQLKPIIERYGKGASVYLWYQGEADCETQRRLVYKQRLQDMAASVRRDARNPDLTVVVIQLSYLSAPPAATTSTWGKMREVQRQFCLEDPRAILVPALPYSHKDSIHLSAEGARALGSRIALALAEAREAGKPVWQGPRPISACFTDAARTQIRVQFDSAKQLRVSNDAIGVLQPVGKQPEGQPEARHEVTEDWYVTDTIHRGEPELLNAVVEKGRLQLTIGGGKLGAAKWDEASRSQSMSVELENGGFLKPTRVATEGLSVILHLPEPAGEDAKVSYALFSHSRSTLMDEQGRPAAAFVDLAVQNATAEAPALPAQRRETH